MANKLLKPKRGRVENLPKLAVEDGSLIFAYNTKSPTSTVLVDVGETRYELSAATAKKADDSNALGGSSLKNIVDKINNATGDGTAFTGLDTTTNNKVKLTRANGTTVEKTVNNVSNASTADYAKVSNKIGTGTVGSSTKPVYINAGTPTAVTSIPSTFVTSQQINGVNLDTLRTPGRYFANGSNTNTGKPTGVDAFALEILQSAGGWYTQICYASNNQEKQFVRYYNSGTSSWSDWVEQNRLNTKTQSGYAPAPNAANKVYRTDASGNPGWGTLNDSSISKLASTVTFGDGNGMRIEQNGDNWRQRINIFDSSQTTQSYSYQQSIDAGKTYKDLFVIGNDGTVVASTFQGALKGTADYSKNSGALGGSSLQNIVDKINNSTGNGTAFTGLDTTTNNKVKLTRANGGTVEKIINNVSNASTADYAKSASNASTAIYLGRNPIARPSDVNIGITGAGGLKKFVVTGAKNQPFDAHIIHLDWDNTGGWDAQIAVEAAKDGHMAVRGMGGSVWGSWNTVLDSANYTSYAAKKNAYNSASVSNATITLGRSDSSTGTTLVVNNVANATSASVAKLISPFENATANVSRNVWFSDSAVRNKACYNDNFKYNPVSQELTAIATTSKYTKGGESESNYQLNSTNLHATIDLSGSTYDVNTWYPVVGSGIPSCGYTRIICYVQLNSGTKPPWASHDGGFTCNFDILVKASGWGTTGAESIILDNSYNWCKSGEPNPLGYQQITQSSAPVIWMRGGGKYFIRQSENLTWSIKTVAYTTNGVTIQPATTYPGVNISRATIYANINGSITGGAANASSAIFSTYTAYPLGFQSRTTSATWGNTTGTFLTGWHTSSGGDIAFMDNNPSSGKVSMKLDGYFYQNEGANRVLDTSDAANYVKKSGDTMTGLLTLKTSNQQGIKLGSAWMTAASDTNGEFVLQGGHLRFGGSAWDYNQWAGLKYDHNKKYIYLGLADSTIFTANSAQSGGSLLTPGISNIYVGGTTQTRVITSSDIDSYVKKSGDTMTGALNFANGTWNKVGDDVKIGDHNIAGSLGVIGANGQTRIDWCQYDNASKYQGIVYDGTKLATSGTFKADYFDGVAKDSQALAGSTLAQIIEAAGGVITITKNLKPTVDWLDTGIAGTALSTGTYIVQVSGLSSGNTPGIYSEIWSGVFSWYSGGTNSTNSDEILLHNAGHADNSNELYLRTIRQGATSGGVMKLQMAVKQASTSTVDVTFKFRKMI